MSNLTVQAAAEGMPEISRCAFLGHAAGAFTAISIVTGATVALADPMLDLITRYREQ